jgi:hypothetical protein
LNVPQDQSQNVSVRRLPDGDSHAASLHSLDGQIMRIDLRPVPVGVNERSAMDVNSGDLVEVICPKTMYLGQVRSRQGETMLVGVEHALDRETLALIQQVWRPSAESSPANHGPGNNGPTEL